MYMCMCVWTCKPLLWLQGFNSLFTVPRARETSSVLLCNGDRREWTGKGKQRGSKELGILGTWINGWQRETMIERWRVGGRWTEDFERDRAGERKQEIYWISNTALCRLHICPTLTYKVFNQSPFMIYALWRWSVPIAGSGVTFMQCRGKHVGAPVVNEYIGICFWHLWSEFVSCSVSVSWLMSPQT